MLLYHSVDDHPAPADRRWTVSRACFERHIEAVAAPGRVALNATQLAEALRGERPLPERPVAITFDDGFADNYEALGALLDRELAPTLYVTTGMVGRRGRLSARQLAELAREPGIEIGAHGVRHQRLDELAAAS